MPDMRCANRHGNSDARLRMEIRSQIFGKTSRVCFQQNSGHSLCGIFYKLGCKTDLAHMLRHLWHTCLAMSGRSENLGQTLYSGDVACCAVSQQHLRQAPFGVRYISSCSPNLWSCVLANVSQTINPGSLEPSSRWAS